jgi:hypothetical protein
MASIMISRREVPQGAQPLGVLNARRRVARAIVSEHRRTLELQGEAEMLAEAEAYHRLIVWGGR